MIRFARAFIQALRLTLRGQPLTPPHYQPLESWIATGLTLLTAAERAAEAESVDPAVLRLKLDGRQTSLESTLQMARHNLVEEYPRLIRLDDPHSMTVVQSSNLNDQYRVGQFAAADAVAPTALKRALDDLNAHLLNLPAIQKPQFDG